MTSTLYMVRHAHVHWRPEESREISAAGHAGARHVAEVLRDRSITAIYASPLPRAIQTVTPLAEERGLPIQIIADLEERRLSGAPVADHHAAVAWCWANPDAALPGGESNTVAQQRGVAAIQAIAAQHPDEAVVIGTHGNLLALILHSWDPSIDFAFWRNLTMPDIYVLQLHIDGSATITRHWDAGDRFLPHTSEAP